MKKFTLIITSLMFVWIASGQVKLESKNHAYTVGDNHDFIIAQHTDEGKAGANITWDFSGLLPAETKLTSFMLEPVSTEKGLMMGNANLALQEDSSFFYYKVTGNTVEEYGSHFGNCLVTLTKPFVKMKYPFGYGDQFKGDYYGIQESNLSKIDVKGTYEVEGDAYGTLILPNGLYSSTLRVKQTRTYKFNNSSDLIEITYRWYTPEIRYPLLVVIKYVMNNQVSEIQKVAYYAHPRYEKTKSTNESGAGSNLLKNGNQVNDVSPNPFDSQLKVNYTLQQAARVSIDLYNASGTLVTNLLSPVEKESGTYQELLDVSPALTTGFYFIKVTMGDETFIKKIVKAL